jgi:serine/threonine protein kinase
MAHATSLGRTVADSGICSPWPEDTFRFAIRPADVLTIAMVDDGTARSPRTAREGNSQLDPVYAGPARVAGLLRDDPRQLGPYRLLGRLGAGGMGQVFLARTAGGRLIAVKVIRAELAGDSGFRVRFAREVAAARKVNGLFTAVVVDADVERPLPWLATAYVAGPSLADAVESHGPLPVGSVLTLAAGLAEGLAAIHAAGVVHRDLKPSNVLLAQDGPRVIDFGISRAAGQYTLTQSGSVIGSPGFMSPEQAEGSEVGPESDVFSLGAVLTFAATGEGPFGSGPSSALLYRVVHHQPRTDHLPGQIRSLIERCLAKDPSQRLSAAGLLEALGAAEPAEGWLPEPTTVLSGPRTAPDLADETARPTVTAEQLPQQPHSPPTRRGP